MTEESGRRASRTLPSNGSGIKPTKQTSYPRIVTHHPPQIAQDLWLPTPSLQPTPETHPRFADPVSNPLCLSTAAASQTLPGISPPVNRRITEHTCALRMTSTRSHLSLRNRVVGTRIAPGFHFAVRDTVPVIRNAGSGVRLRAANSEAS